MDKQYRAHVRNGGDGHRVLLPERELVAKRRLEMVKDAVNIGKFHKSE
jgi:hypothetical protein